MSNKTKDWRLTDLKICKDCEEQAPFCLALLRFYSIDFKKTENIIYYRNLRHQRSYFSWKILSLGNQFEEDNRLNENKLEKNI